MAKYVTATGLFCPKCPVSAGRGKLFVQDGDVFYDGDEYEAQCDTCDALFNVMAKTRDVEFHDPTPVDP